jgi:hypothetical protein
MLLYHGTTAKHLKSILRDGLRPRGTKAGRWQDWPSRPDCTYLTSAYGFYFAMACPLEDGDRLVLEIDTQRLDQSLLLPDEDFIAQGLIAANPDADLAGVHAIVRDKLDCAIATDGDGTSFAVGFRDGDSPWNGQPAWEVSVTYLTTCCYKGTISPAAFSRYVLFDYTQRPLLSTMAYNDGVRLKGPHQQMANLTAWFFGDRKKLPRYIPHNCAKDIDEPVRSYVLNPKWEREQAWRHGINVVTLK